MNRLNLFTLKHNLLVGTPNQTGKRWGGHCEIWEYNHLQQISEKTRDLVPDSQMIEGWVNGNMYIPTTEVWDFANSRDNSFQECNAAFYSGH